MLIIREYKENEVQDIKELLVSENIKDLDINEIIFVMVEDKDIIGVCKIAIENYIGDLKYLVIKENKRNKKLKMIMERAKRLLFFIDFILRYKIKIPQRVEKLITQTIYYCG